jgi:hypothetical protein
MIQQLPLQVEQRLSHLRTGALLPFGDVRQFADQMGPTQLALAGGQAWL